MQVNMGMAGEFRCVVKRADGSTKVDTGYQKNLILNQGLDFFGGGKGSSMLSNCVIGSGNSQPNYTQNKLDAAITGVSGTFASNKYDYNAAIDGELYKINYTYKYSFTGLSNVNVSELGLASTYSNTTTYFLCTRALIKDSQGNPTTITVLSGEILEIYYKLWVVFDTRDKTGQINLLDGIGGSAKYNWLSRIALAGDTPYGLRIVGSPLAGAIYNESHKLRDGDLGVVGGASQGNIIWSSSSELVLSDYVPGTYKRQLQLDLPVSSANGNIRSFNIYTTMGIFQIRFGSVADDSPITKTNTQTLTIPVEISWGRYEGAL